jgi:hypothetical protein
MDIAYLVRKENDKLVWSDTGKSARIRRVLINQEETRYFDDKPATLQEAIRAANIFMPYAAGLAKGAEITFLEPELHLDSDRPYFTVKYVEAKR